MTKRIALVTHDLSLGGGVGTMTAFLSQVIARSSHYQADIISLATAASDRASLRLTSPGTWRNGVQVQPATWRGLSYTHVGAWASELEFQRYRPRPALTQLLQSYDLLQFIVGSPPWVCAVTQLQKPTLLWTATTTWADRATRVRSGSLARRTWSSTMTRLTQPYETQALQQADRVFALSDYTLKSIQPLMQGKPIHMAPCGVDTSVYRPATSPSRNYILCAARLSDARKNVTLLLNAYALLHKRMPDLPPLYLAGEPPSAAAQELLTRLNIADKVQLLGEKQGEELADLYRNALLFVLSSDEEGLGIVIIEAMASGVPVVSTACGGPETAVSDGKTGFLTPVGDASALAAAMQKLLDDPALALRMGQAGRQVAEARFSLDAAGKVFLDAYDEFLSQQESPRLVNSNA